MSAVPARGRLRQVARAPDRVQSLQSMWFARGCWAFAPHLTRSARCSLDLLADRCAAITSLHGMPDDLVMELLARILRRGKLTVPVARLLARSSCEPARESVCRPRSDLPLSNSLLVHPSPPAHHAAAAALSSRSTSLPSASGCERPSGPPRPLAAVAFGRPRTLALAADDGLGEVDVEDKGRARAVHDALRRALLLRGQLPGEHRPPQRTQHARRGWRGRGLATAGSQGGSGCECAGAPGRPPPRPPPSAS